MRVSVEGRDFEVDSAGTQGPTIVLVHGLGGSRRTWRALIEVLSPRARVVAPDLSGCGDTPRPPQTWSIAGAADDLEALLVALDVSRCVLVGHSLGGVIVEELLTRRLPMVAAAVLISTSSRLSDRATENWLRIADLVETRGLSDSPAARARGFSDSFAAARPEIVDEHARITAATDPRVYAEQARAASRYDYTEALASVSCPVLILQGLADQLTPPGGSVLLHRALPDGARLEMLDGVGHNLPFEIPERVAELILDFAAEAVPAS